MYRSNDFVLTIDSDDENLRSSRISAYHEVVEKSGDDAELFNADFSISFTDEFQASINGVQSHRRNTPLQHNKERKRKRKRFEGVDSFGKRMSSDDEDSESITVLPIAKKKFANHEELENYDSSSEPDPDSESNSESDRKAAFFSSLPVESTSQKAFQEMNLSRPILKALDSMSFHSPTAIQAAAIPVALLGKDIVGNAVTGSGKTAAFIIPVLERLLFRERGKKASAIRCVVLVPTRELAMQCFDVGRKLASHTDIRFSLIVGGLSLKSQEAELRTQPDILIATPGRLIDHLRNSPVFGLDALDILILDEADRMLSDGFAEELKEIIASCPLSRQTMLFSATMTDSVDKLIKMSLDKPVKLFVNPKRTVAQDLVQEFVRIRASRESDRMPTLVSMCNNNFKSGVLVFVRSKRLAHQLKVIFELIGLKCGELHGDMTQEQRFQSLQQFREKTMDFLIATDLASRGLDVTGIETVINYDMPNTIPLYLHRIGRTARAGRKGRAVTLIGEADRKMFKSIIKHSFMHDRVFNRTVSSEDVAECAKILEKVKDEVSNVMKQEKEEKAIRQAEMELNKSQNILDHHEEIFSRPARDWFRSSQRRHSSKDVDKKPNTLSLPKRKEFAGLSRKAKRRKMAVKDGAHEDSEVKAAIRKAKRSARSKHK